MIQNNSGKKALKAGFGYVVGDIFSKGLSFLAAFIFARLMSPTDYGVYSIYNSYVSILTVGIGFALHVSIKNAYLDYPNHLDEYCSSVTILTLTNTLLVLIAAILFRHQLGEELSIPSSMVVMIVVESFGFSILQFYNDYLAVRYHSKEYVTISFTYAATSIVLSVILICTIFSDARYIGRATGSLIPIFLISLYILFQFYRRSKPKINIAYWKYGLKISLPIIPHGISQLVLGQFDRIMISKAIGTAEAGLYSFSNNIGLILLVITNSLNTAWTPWFFERMEQKDYYSIRKYSSMYVCIISVLSIGLMLISPELILILGGESYMGSCYVVMPIILSVFFSFLYTIPSCIEYYYKKTNVIALGTMGTAILNVVLNSAFIPRYGYIAAAYTTVFCYICYYLVHLIMSNKIQGNMIFDARVLLACPIAMCILTAIFGLLIDQLLIRYLILGMGLLGVSIVILKNRVQILDAISNKSAKRSAEK